MKYFTHLTPLLMLSACLGQTDAPVEPASSFETSAVISVNMTFDRDIDFKVSDIAVVPNNVAPWAGSLFVIDDKTNLLRGDLESGDFKPTAETIKAIAPLARRNKAGLLLTLNQQNQIGGFFEINDDSDYEAIPLSNAPETLINFCTQNILSEQRVYGRDEKGHILALDITSPEDNHLVTAKRIDNLEAQNDADCAVYIKDKDVRAVTLPNAALDTALIGPDSLLFTTEESRTRPRLFLKRNDDIMAIDITGGLSTQAPSQIDSIYVIPNSLGGSLRDGAVIIADNQTGRLIYISLGFLQMRLNETAAAQGQAAN